MPKKTYDESKDWSIYSMEPSIHIAPEAAIQIASDYALPCSTMFLRQLDDWSSIYKTNKIAFEEIPTWKQRRNIFHDLSTKIDNLSAALNSLGSCTLESLSEIRLDDNETTHELSGYWRSVGLLTPSFSNNEEINLGQIFKTLELLELRTKQLKKHYSASPPDDKNTPPLRDMPRRVLVQNIAEYWTNNLGREYNNHFDPNDEFGEPKCAPIGEAAKFTVDIINLIDSELGSQIDTIQDLTTEAKKSLKPQS